NAAEIVRWNVDKHYLLALERAGVAIVPSTFCERGADVDAALDAFLGAWPDMAEFVAKPAIGAGSRDAERHARADRAAAAAQIERLLAAGRSVVLQPYLGRIDADGETALVFFDGEFSHAIRKGALLRRGAPPTRALFAAEHITPRAPAADELAAARRTLAALPFAEPLAYARVDLIRDGGGAPRVLELELVEPSLFFATAAGAAERFAAAILRRAGA
ncbi:MAG TPA: hypothetical protein VGC30_07965, partial [Dokdonella sp.]